MVRLKKLFVASVMMTTVFSMCAFVVPQANAASAGDLIKMNGLSSVYYLGADNKRYVFPNENTYFSWYGDFSSVKTVAQSELESYPLGKNITMRPGTKLVKITTDPKVYAVEPNGTLKWVPSEAVAKALWGDMWAKRVVDVSDAFFTNYTIAAGQVSSTAYPAGSLIKKPGAADVYYIATDGAARKITTEAAFVANRFNWNDVVTTSADFSLPGMGADLSAADSVIIDTSSGAGGAAGAGTGLTVALSGDTAASKNIPSGALNVPFVTVNFTAANDGDVTINNLVFTRKGTGPTSDFDGGYLFSGDSRLTTKRSVNSSDQTITFSSVNLVIKAGTTQQVTLKMNANTGDRTGNHYFQLTSASAVSTNGAVVSGSFPVMGNTMAFSSVDTGTVTIDGQAGTYDRKIGETGVMLSEFTIQNDATEVAKIYSIRLKQEGTAGDDSISNLKLEVDGTVVKSGVSMSSKYVDFVFDSPMTLDKSKTVTAYVYGDVVGDITKTVQFYLKEASDADIRGSAYGDFYGVQITNSFTTTTGPVVTIKGSEVNVSFDGPQAQDVKADSQNVVLANFKISSVNLDVNIDTLTVTLAQAAAMNNKPLLNVEMVDSTNNAAYSVTDPASSTPASLAFENIYLKKGVQYNFQIRGDVQDGTNVGATYQVSINFASGFTAQFQDSDETAVVIGDLSASALSGKVMTVAAPIVSLAKVTTSDSTVVKDAMGVLLYKGKIVANSVDNLKVSRVKFDANFGTITKIGDAFSRIYLYKVNADNSETKLDDESSLSSATDVTFSGFTLDIPKGTSNGVYVVIRGDVKTSPTAGSIAFKWNNTDSNFIVRDSDSNTVSTITQDTAAGQTTSIAAKGIFTMTFVNDESDTNADKNVLAGTRVLVGRVKLTASKEKANLEDLTIKNVAGSATANDVAYLRLYAEKGMTTLLGEASFDASKNATFEDVNIEIPTTGVKYVYVAADLKGIDYSNSPAADSTATAARNIDLEIGSTTGFIVKAVGKDTGEVLENNGVASTTSTMTATILGATMSNITTAYVGGLLNDGVKDIFSFKVTVPASSNMDFDGTALGIKLASTTMNVSSSTGITLSSVNVRRVGGANGEVAANLVGNAGSTLRIDWLNTYGASSDLIVRPGETAEYIISATVAGVSGTGKSLQVTIETVDTNVKYVHNTGSLGVDGADTAVVSPLLSGISSVRGGSLTN